VEAHDDGRVVLSGEVGSAEAKAAAVRTAAGVADVTRVDDRLGVNPALAARTGGGGRSLGENLDDHALEAKVRLALSLQKDMKGADVTVSAYRREVTLAGTVISDSQRELALQVARRTPQVAAVKDMLQVAGRPAASPSAGVAGGDDKVQAVQAALAANVNLAPYRLEARMQGSRLVLSGRVRTGAEKDLAGIVARDAAGTAIDNNVVVQP
jgi:osmotically-inducible protein OsmY